MFNLKSALFLNSLFPPSMYAPSVLKAYSVVSSPQHSRNSRRHWRIPWETTKRLILGNEALYFLLLHQEHFAALELIHADCPLFNQPLRPQVYSCLVPTYNAVTYSVVFTAHFADPAVRHRLRGFHRVLCEEVLNERFECGRPQASPENILNLSYSSGMQMDTRYDTNGWE